MRPKKETRYDSPDNNHPLVIAYYTIDTPYQHEAEILKLSLESIGYSYVVCGIPNLGSWQKNTQYKAQFVDYMLNRFSNKSLLYLDVDAVMIKSPKKLDDLNADIGAVYFAGSRNKELLSGTLYLGNTKQCKRAIKKWIQINERYPEILPNGREAWDQRTLKRAIKKTKNIDFKELPQNYTYIVELTQRHCPDIEPVILHTRGAKRFKNIINGQKGYAK